MPDIKNKISKYINELIETSGQIYFDCSVFNRKKKEVLNFIKKNNNKINNYEKVYSILIYIFLIMEII